MLLPNAPLPFSLSLGQPPPKPPRHYLPFSLSEWDVRMRRANKANANCDNDVNVNANSNCYWNYLVKTDRRRRSRSWSSTKAAAAEETAATSHAKFPSAAKCQKGDNGKGSAQHHQHHVEDADHVDDVDDDDGETSSHTVGRSSFYIRFCNSLTLRRSYDDRRRPGNATAADDATSLDTWLSRRRHRRRNGFNLTPVTTATEGNGNSRFGRLVSCSFGKLREVFSLSTHCGNGVKSSTAGEEKGTNWTAPPEGAQTAPVGGTFKFDAPKQTAEEWKKMTTPPEGINNAKVDQPLGQHCQWLRYQTMLIDFGGGQNGQGNAGGEQTTNEGRMS